MISTKFITLDSIVRDFLSQKEAETPHMYLRLLNIANAGLRELTYDVLGSTKTAIMEVSSTMRIDLPEGFVDYTYIGVISSSGLLSPLGKNSSLPRVGTGNVQVARESLDEIDSDFQQISTEFGLGGGQNSNGYYAPSIDYDNWQMILSSTYVGSSIYMEFISDGRVSDGNTVIHPYAEEALKAYIHWKDLQRKSGVDPNSIMLARKDYFNEKRLSKSRFSSFTKEEALQQIRKNFKQSPKM